MNITVNQNRFNSSYDYQNYGSKKAKVNTPLAYNTNKTAAPTFTGWNPFDLIPVKSKFLDPVKRGFDNITTGIAKYYTVKVYTSPLAKWLAKHSENLDGIVGHMQVAGSVIISGMYMIQTLRQKDLDEDRKKTLAINQGLTFGVSTLGSYLIDNSLDEWWESVTQKYASKQLGDDKLSEKIRTLNMATMKDDLRKAGSVLTIDQKLTEKKQYKALQKQWAKLKKDAKSPLVNALKYIEENAPNTGMEKEIYGMGVFKKLLVFGTVYRFLSPVAVTPLASKIGDWLAENKKQKAEKTAEATASGNTSPKTQDGKKPEETKQAA